MVQVSFRGWTDSRNPPHFILKRYTRIPPTSSTACSTCLTQLAVTGQHTVSSSDAGLLQLHRMEAGYCDKKDILGMKTLLRFSPPGTNRCLQGDQDAFCHINTDFCDVIEQGAAAVLAALPKQEASHLRTEGVTMEVSCMILVLERPTENSI